MALTLLLGPGHNQHCQKQLFPEAGWARPVLPAPLSVCFPSEALPSASGSQLGLFHF